MRLLVTGAAGQLGAAMCDRLGGRHDVVALRRADLDVSDAASVRRAVAAASPAVVINCAAYNAVDQAEDDVRTAFEVNAFAVRDLARAAAAAGAVLVHFSTDFVFDGEADAPYTEESAPRPRSVYAQSKLAGEWFAADCPAHYVLRVESLFGGPRRRSSVDLLLEKILAGTPPTVFVDRTVSPSLVEDVVQATEALLDQRAPYGLYHCVNTGAVTWMGIAEEILRLTGRTTPVHARRMADVALRAPRPLYCVLSNEKLARAGIPMPTWQDALARHLRAFGQIS